MPYNVLFSFLEREHCVLSQTSKAVNCPFFILVFSNFFDMDILKITKPSVCLFILSILLLAFTWPLISSIWSISETVLNNAQDSTKDYGQGFQTIWGDITSWLNKAWSYMQWRNPNIDEMKGSHEYHTQSDLKNYILSKNLTRDQAKTLVDSLINSWHIIEWINEAPLPQYRINLAHSILWRILVRWIRDFGFTMGEYAMWLWNLGVGTMNWDLYIFMKWVLWLSLSIICTFILVTALSIFIKYISFSLKIFPRLFLNILWPAQSPCRCRAW